MYAVETKYIRVHDACDINISPNAIVILNINIRDGATVAVHDQLRFFQVCKLFF